MAALRHNDDLLSVGAYVAGTNPTLDDAIARRDALRAFLCQPADTLCGFSDAVEHLTGLAGGD
jgi:flagellar biosynthesis/type III secretory pathway ATPase